MVQIHCEVIKMRVTIRLVLILIYRIDTIGSQTFEEVARGAVCKVSADDKLSPDNCRMTTEDVVELDEEANAIATVFCRRPRSIIFEHNHGIFIIGHRLEHQLNETWNNVTRFSPTRTAVFGLDSEGPYVFRFHRVFANGISRPEITDSIKSKSTFQGWDEVKNISVKSIRVQADNPHRIESVISFFPSEDQPCSYTVTLWNTTYKRRCVKAHAVAVESSFSNLSFDKNYTVFINSTFNLSEMNGATMTFVTPTCLKVHNNLKICAPEEVQGIRGERIHKPENISDVNVTWDKPDLLPDYYIVELYLNSSKTRKMLLHNVSGIDTQSLFSDVEILDEYNVAIVACSLGGKSPRFVGKLSFTVRFLEMNNINTILTSSFGLILGSIALAYGCHVKRKRRQKRAEDFKMLDLLAHPSLDATKNVGKSAPNTAKVEDLVPPIDEYEIEPDRLEIEQPLGRGAFGIVKRGSLRDDRGLVTAVAVKMLQDKPTDAEQLEFQREIQMMKMIKQHPNIVSILGCCTVGSKPLLIVEYCSQGDLQSFLRAILAKVSTDWVLVPDSQCISKKSSVYDDVDLRYDSDTVTIIDLLNFGRQVARGMEFLSSNRVVHRDLAARNVLVCDDRIVKISDFGLSRDIYLENIYVKQSNGRLPIKWMAIEALTHQIYDTRSDVWAFGILLWEIITLGSNPYPTIPPIELLKWLKLGYRMEQPENCSIPLYNLMLSCWQAKPNDRPTFTSLREELDKLISMAAEKDYFDLLDTTERELAKEKNSYLISPHRTMSSSSEVNECWKEFVE